MAPSGLPDERLSAHYRLFIIQEYCDAGSLAQAIDSGRFIDPSTQTNNMASRCYDATDCVHCEQAQRACHA